MNGDNRNWNKPVGSSGGRDVRTSSGLFYFAAVGVLVALLVAVVGFSSVGSSGAGSKEAVGHPAPEVMPLGSLAADSDSHEFGLVHMGNGKVSHAFRLRNTGSEPALIRKIYTSCLCINATLLAGGESHGPYGMRDYGHAPTPDINHLVEPGQEVTVQAVFDPSTYGEAGLGLNTRAVSVKLGNGKQLRLKLIAFVTQ